MTDLLPIYAASNTDLTSIVCPSLYIFLLKLHAFVYQNYEKKKSGFNKGNLCLGFSCNVFHETGINVVNSPNMLGIQPFFFQEITWYQKCKMFWCKKCLEVIMQVYV